MGLFATPLTEGVRKFSITPTEFWASAKVFGWPTLGTSCLVGHRLRGAGHTTVGRLSGRRRWSGGGGASGRVQGHRVGRAVGLDRRFQLLLIRAVIGL